MLKILLIALVFVFLLILFNLASRYFARVEHKKTIQEEAELEDMDKALVKYKKRVSNRKRK